jgi:hypothetical protein
MLFILSITWSFTNSSNSISLDYTIYFTILTVNALNLGCPTAKYSNNIGMSFSFFNIVTNA